MTLGVDSSIIDKVVGISNNSRDGSQNMIINFVEFAGLFHWHKKFGDFLLLSSQNDTYTAHKISKILTIFSENADDRSILVNVFNSILDLLQSTIWIEGGSALIVLARLRKG